MLEDVLAPDRTTGLRTSGLIGIGLYTAPEAARLLDLPSSRITRWLCGHQVGATRYEPLWRPQVGREENGTVLGFRDLMEVRVAAALIGHGLSPQRVRRAIVLARDLIGDEHPLSTTRFRTDGRSIFLQSAEAGDDDRLLDLFADQYAFRAVLEPSLRDVDHDGQGAPMLWWPMGRSKLIVLDPERSFGQPIESETSVPTVALAAAAKAEGSVATAAKLWSVPVRAVKRAVAFERRLEERAAA